MGTVIARENHTYFWENLQVSLTRLKKVLIDRASEEDLLIEDLLLEDLSLEYLSLEDLLLDHRCNFRRPPFARGHWIN